MENVETITISYLTCNSKMERVGEREEGRAVCARSSAIFPQRGPGRTRLDERRGGAGGPFPQDITAYQD
jgi:hypothetical protein